MKDLKTLNPKSVFKLLTEIVEALGQASGAASQLIFHYGDPVGMMVIRDALDLTKEGCFKLAKQQKLIV